MNNQSLEIASLRFGYPDGPDVLSGVDLTVAPGEKTALVGPNAAGKTTLFLLVCGILEARAGTVTVSGETVRHGRFNRRVSYLFQSPDDQLFSARVYDDVAFGPLNMGLSAEEVRRRSEAALKQVKCEELADKPPHHLSGGEKRMVALATILSMSPDILLLDEPTSNLDLKNRRKVIQTINAIDTTMIIASHDLEFLLETCRSAVVLDKGGVAARGEIVEILSNKAFMAAHGLEKPHSLYPHSHG